jgi:copper(I)-binding protein
LTKQTRACVFAGLAMFLCLFILSGTGCDKGTPALAIEEPQALLSPMMLGVGSVFMTIVNNGNGDDALVAARTDMPGTITELHDVKDGKMANVEKIPIRRNSTVTLRPGNFHIMIFKMPKDVKAGDRMNLTLSFALSGDRTIPLELRKYASPEQGHAER